MEAHCRKIKQEHPDANIVFIGPCISKKEEAEAFPGYVDCVLTFEELSDWLKQEASPWSRSGRHQGEPCPAVPHHRRHSALHEVRIPRLHLPDGRRRGELLAALEDIKPGRLQNCFIEMSICEGSCIGGPAMERERRRPVR